MQPKLNMNGQVTVQHNAFESSDLGTSDKDLQDSISVQPRVKIKGDLSDTLKTYADIRAVLIEGNSGAQDDTGQIVFNKDFLEVRQLWLKRESVFGHGPLGFQIGRQRLKESRTNWWNRDIDSARMLYNSTLFKGFLGVGQNLSSYRTSDGDFMEDDEDRLRVFAEGSWQWKYNHYFDIRGLYEHDYSGIEEAGEQIRTDDQDRYDADLVWVGTRFKGTFKPKGIKTLSYNMDGMMVAGREDTLTTGPGSTDEFRTVTSVTGRDVLGWALDADVDIALDHDLSPTVTFGYAYGSGDPDSSDGKDKAFRQTGLHGNATRLGASTGALRNFGDVLQPELSNLHVLTAGAGMLVGTFSDLNLFYHYYHLDEPAAALRHSSIAADLNGRDRSLGHGADLIFNTDLSKQFGLQTRGLDNMRFKFLLSGFRAGEAYGDAEHETAFRLFSELQVRF